MSRHWPDRADPSWSAQADRPAGAGLRSLAEPWVDTTSPAGRMVLTVFAGIAEFERALIHQRTGAGRIAAKHAACALRPTSQAYGRPDRAWRTLGWRGPVCSGRPRSCSSVTTPPSTGRCLRQRHEATAKAVCLSLSTAPAVFRRRATFVDQVAIAGGGWFIAAMRRLPEVVRVLHHAGRKRRAPACRGGRP